MDNFTTTLLERLLIEVGRLADAQEVANGLTMIAAGMVDVKSPAGTAFQADTMQAALDRLRALKEKRLLHASVKQAAGANGS
jgi:hypothetical protein